MSKIFRAWSVAMQILSLAFAALFLALSIYFVFEVGVIYPIFAMLLMFAVFGALGIHYRLCLRHILERRVLSERELARRKIASSACVALFGFCAFVMWLMLFAVYVLEVRFDFLGYFIAVAIISTLYTANLTLLSKKLN